MVRLYCHCQCKYDRKLDEAIAMVRFRSIPTERTVTDENGEEQTEELNFDPFYAAAPLPDLTQ